MPTITPQARATIGGSSDVEAPARRTSVSASTGMNMPTVRETKPTPSAGGAAPVSGHPSMGEETTAPAVTLSPQLTALARKQQKLQQEIQAQRDREAAFDAKQADYIPKSSLTAKFETDALGALKDLGMTYEQFNERLLAQLNGADPVKELRSEFDQFKKTQEESVNKQYDATLKQYRSEADALIAADPKAFHLITKGKHQDAVVQHIVETWEADPDQVLTVSQAAKEVEEVLRENARAYADALKEIDPPAEATAQSARKTLPPPKAAAPRTLTSQVEATPQPRAHGQFQHLSMKERIAQAVARSQR